MVDKQHMYIEKNQIDRPADKQIENLAQTQLDNQIERKKGRLRKKKIHRMPRVYSRWERIIHLIDHSSNTFGLNALSRTMA